MVDMVPSHAASGTFTLGETQVLVDCAYFAGSGQVREAANEILALLQSVVHQDAAALLAWDPLAGKHVVLGNSAYDVATLIGLGEPYAQTEPHQRMLEQHRPLRMADLPYDYRQTKLPGDTAPGGLRGWNVLVPLCRRRRICRNAAHVRRVTERV